MTAFALLPSPLLGSAVWAAVARRLTASGDRVVTVDLGEAPIATPDDVLSAYLPQLPVVDDLVLVPQPRSSAAC